MKRKGYLVLVLLLLFLLVPTALCVAQPLPLGNLDAYIQKAIEDWNVAGMAIAIVKDDDLVYARGFGLKDIDKRTTVDEHTLFAIGSTSKAFTVASLGMLVDEEKVEWDDKVTDHLPEFQLFDPYVTRELTIRDLLCHRSGLSRGDQLWYGSYFTREEVMHRVRFLEPSWSFRSRYGYQNIMFLVAGQLIARVTGKSWDENIKERIFEPLGMDESNTSITAFKQGDNYATPHGGDRDSLYTIPWRNIDNIAPAGSINSSVVDMARWLRLQLGSGTFEGKEFWSEGIQREMHSPHTISGRLRTGFSHFSLYGLGWALQDYRGRYVASHTGGIDGMNALVALMPEESLGLVMLSNVRRNPIMSPLMYRIFDAYLGVPEEEWRDVGEPRPPAAEEAERPQPERPELPEGTTPSLPLERYEGNYTNQMCGDVKVELRDGKLFLIFQAYPSAILEHRHLDTFRASFQDHLLSDTNVSFTIDAAARITEMTVSSIGVFRRVER